MRVTRSHFIRTSLCEVERAVRTIIDSSCVPRTFLDLSIYVTMLFVTFVVRFVIPMFPGLSRMFVMFPGLSKRFAVFSKSLTSQSSSLLSR